MFVFLCLYILSFFCLFVIFFFLSLFLWFFFVLSLFLILCICLFFIFFGDFSFCRNLSGDDGGAGQGCFGFSAAGVDWSETLFLPTPLPVTDQTQHGAAGPSAADPLHLAEGYGKNTQAAQLANLLMSYTHLYHGLCVFSGPQWAALSFSPSVTELSTDQQSHRDAPRKPRPV